VQERRLRERFAMLSATDDDTNSRLRLSGGRGARRAMQRERIQRGRIFRKNGVPGHLPRFGDQIQGRGRQRRHVQRLAHMAGSVRPAGVLVDVRAAGGEVQQGRAAKYGQRALAGNESGEIHMSKAAHVSVAA